MRLLSYSSWNLSYLLYPDGTWAAGWLLVGRLECVGGLQDPGALAMVGGSGHHVAGCPAGWPMESPPLPPSGEEEEEEEPPNGNGSSSGGLAGTVFRLHFLGSVEVDEEGGRKRRKRLKKHMVEEAVTKIKVASDSARLIKISNGRK
ncbi:hypothetical protein ANN_23099 [Periplaneta americana]|uniref:Uncharacterized protein n=1 Tax=Periplaneta americana TaxID=6978 RepID=A0ABQ8SLE0_PERAM|nr:hypothetical protein ANN_23099 [Periplaneta americana]